MLIQSRFKDYYDYLQGKWGVDEKLVLDRTEFTKIDNLMLSDHTVYHVHVAGYQYDFFYKDGKFIYGEEIYELYPESKGKKESWYTKWMRSDKIGPGISIPHINGRSWEILWMYTKPVPSKVNDHFLTPILFEHYSGRLTMDKGQRSFLPNPILKDIAFHKAVEAEDLWLILSQWLSRQKDKPMVDHQTDKEKIVGKGFDLVKSFRHRK